MACGGTALHFIYGKGAEMFQNPSKVIAYSDELAAEKRETIHWSRVLLFSDYTGSTKIHPSYRPHAGTINCTDAHTYRQTVDWCRRAEPTEKRAHFTTRDLFITRRTSAVDCIILKARTFSMYKLFHLNTVENDAIK
jgi:hypothetical protein